jgi:hypothetical protein
VPKSNAAWTHIQVSEDKISLRTRTAGYNPLLEFNPGL